MVWPGFRIQCKLSISVSGGTKYKKKENLSDFSNRSPNNVCADGRGRTAKSFAKNVIRLRKLSDCFFSVLSEPESSLYILLVVLL